LIKGFCRGISGAVDFQPFAKRKSSQAQTLQKLMRERLGIKDFDMSNANAIYRSCQDIYSKHGKMLGLCVEMMIMRAGMQQAEYFVCGVDEEEWRVLEGFLERNVEQCCR